MSHVAPVCVAAFTVMHLLPEPHQRVEQSLLPGIERRVEAPRGLDPGLHHARAPLDHYAQPVEPHRLGFGSATVGIAGMSHACRRRHRRHIGIERRLLAGLDVEQDRQIPGHLLLALGHPLLERCLAIIGRICCGLGDCRDRDGERGHRRQK